MATLSQSPVFESLFQSALDEYENQTGINLLQHPLAVQLERCSSVESITEVLQQQAQAFREFRGSNNRIATLLRHTIQILHKLSAHVVLGEQIVLPVSLVKTIHTCIGTLLSTVKDVSASYDALVDLLESILNFLKRLDIYTRIPSTMPMTEIIVKILVQLISTLAVATKQIKQGRMKKFGKKLLGDNDVEAVLHRLDRLTLDEARTTAAQTLEVVYGLVQNLKGVISDQQASTGSIREALELMQQITSDMNKSRRDQLRRDVQRWLSPPDPWKNHNIGRATHHNGTARWFIEGDSFSEWKSSPRSLLWIHGKPGCGKSIICSTVIENIECMRKLGFATQAFYYFDFRDDEKKHLRGLLSSLLFQLCDQSDAYHDILSKLYSTHRDGLQQPSDSALTECLTDILALPGQAPLYLILDALDECPNASGTPSPRETVLMLVKDLVDLCVPSLHICLTSRPEVDIKTALDPLKFYSISLHDEEGQKQDILDYINSVVHSDPKTQKWRAEDKHLVIDVLSQNANGMFRWVFCQFDSLRRCLPGRIRRSLDELPTTLDATYDRTLEDIDEKNWEYALRLFQCVTVASRPLSVKELAEFLAFDFNAGMIPKFREDWRLPDPVDAVLSTCSTLLAIVNVDGSLIVQFSHFSVKEYLTSVRLAEASNVACRRYHVSMPHAHTLAAQACLGILLHLDEDINRYRLENFPLAEYAAEHWVDHSLFNQSRNIEDAMKRLVDPRKPHFAVWIWIHDPMSWPWMQKNRAERPSPPRQNPLRYAARCGLHAVVEFLVVEHSQDVNCLDIYDRSTSLHEASSQGHAKAVRALLECGADARAQDRQGRSPLHKPSSEGHLEVVRVLLEGGADVKVQDKEEKSPLHLSSSKGHAEVARVLLEGGANVRARDKDGKSPLHEASSPGHVEVARVLLEGGADANAQDKNGRSPLHEASSGGHVEVARVLLNCGADAMAQDKDGKGPLYGASTQGHVEVARVLLDRGADATAPSKHAWSLLHEVSSKGHVEVVRLLLDRGADARAQDEQGRDPLYWASYEGHLEVAHVLLAAGADARAQDKFGRSPLQQASFGGHVELVQVLLDHGANASAQDGAGQSPLYEASSWGHVDVVRVLLNHGADASAQDQYGRSPLFRASSEGHTEVAYVLLERGADASAQDKQGQSPLHEASFQGHAELARALIDYGADAKAQDKDGRSPLYGASSRGHAELARILLDYGADVTARDKQGKGPLHEASSRGHLGVARVLLEGGADVTAQDKDGKSPLYEASSQGHVKLAQVLLNHGADATALDINERSPLHEALRQGHSELVRVLLDHGADAKAQDKHGQSPLHLVPFRGYFRDARMLLDRGADARAQDKSGRSPLHWASFVGDAKLVHMLLEEGADAKAQGNDGQSPLHQASAQGRADIVRMLLEGGADVIAQDKEGQSPLHLASSEGYADVARVLLEGGANVRAQDNHGKSPLRLASSGGHPDVADILLQYDPPTVGDDCISIM